MSKKVVLVVIALIVGAAIWYNARDTGAVTGPVEVAGLDDAAQLVQMAQGITAGDPGAPITIVEFADYQCPACGSFNATEKPQVDLAYVQTGLAKFVFYDFPLTGGHPHAFLAARAARCAEEQGHYWDYHDALFRRQSSWSASPKPPVGPFEDYAAEVGLDQDAFRACLRSDRFADVVTANMRLGVELGVSATPTIMISRGSGSARRPASPAFPDIRVLMDEFLADTVSNGGTP